MSSFDNFLAELHEAFSDDQTYTVEQVAEIVHYLRISLPAECFGIEAKGAHVVTETVTHAGGEVDFDAAGNMVGARLTDCPAVLLT